MDDTQRASSWRDKHRVHPFADEFPMMSDEELAVLGADIMANGLKQPIVFWSSRQGNASVRAPASRRQKPDGGDGARRPRPRPGPMPKPKSGKPVVGIDAVRQCYLDRCAAPGVDLDAEQKIVFDALREIASKRAMQVQSPWTNPTPDIGQLVDDLLLGAPIRPRPTEAL